MRGAVTSVFCDQQMPPLSATSDECRQFATVRRHSVYNTRRLHPLTTCTAARYWLKRAIFHTPPAFSTSVTGSLLEYCHNVWCGKTRMAWLPDGE